MLSGCGHGLAVPSYDEVILRHQSLAHGHPDVTRILFYGDSVENRPLMALRIARVPMSPEADSVLVIGAIHGDEYMNIVDRLGEWLLNQAHDNWLDKERHVETAQHLAKILWGDIVVGDWKSVLDYTGKGNATDYFYERYGALSFLFEGNFNEQDYFSRHTEAWRYLLTTTMSRGRNDDGI